MPRTPDRPLPENERGEGKRIQADLPGESTPGSHPGVLAEGDLDFHLYLFPLFALPYFLHRVKTEALVANVEVEERPVELHERATKE